MYKGQCTSFVDSKLLLYQEGEKKKERGEEEEVLKREVGFSYVGKKGYFLVYASHLMLNINFLAIFFSEYFLIHALASVSQCNKFGNIGSVGLI